MSKKTKVLIFIDWFSPGYKAGGPIRSCLNLISHLSGSIDFFVVTRDTDYMDDKPYKEIKSNEWVRSPKENANVYYISKDNLKIKTIRNIINAGPWDYIYLNHSFSFYFSIIPLFLSKKIKVIIAPRGAYADGALSVKPLKKNIFIHLANFCRIYKNVIFQATTEVEKVQIQKLVKHHRKVIVAQNLPSKENKNFKSKILKEVGELKLFYLARISPEKNLLFALNVLKNSMYSGEIRYDIYGAINDKKYWGRCVNVINDLPPNIKVEYKGPVNSTETNEVISNYHFLYLPTLGENFGHSILESLNMNVPVIISDQTPWKELFGKNIGWDLKLNEEAFCKVISLVLNLSDTDFQKIQKSCSDYMKNYLNNSVELVKSKEMFL